MYVHIDMYIHIYVYLVLAARDDAVALDVLPGHVDHAAVAAVLQKYTGKGTWRQGIVVKHRNSSYKGLCPVVICPYLCSSESSLAQKQTSSADRGTWNIA